jgi:integrase
LQVDPAFYQGATVVVPKLNFTAAALKAAFTKNPRAVLYDAQQRGLFAYMTSVGQISLGAHYRLAGPNRQVKKTIGRLGHELSVGEARSRVAALVLAGKAGEDLRPTQRKALTLQAAYEAHRQSLIRRGASAGTLAFQATCWKLRLSQHGRQELASLSRGSVREMHDSWRKYGVAAANNSARLLRTILNYSIKKLDADIQLNPATSIEFFAQRNKREAVTDLAAFWTAVGTVKNPICRGVRQIAILSGLRKNDILTIRWEHVGEDRIYIPFPKMKRPFFVPMTDALRDVLQDLREHGEVMFPNSPYVCPGAGTYGHLRNPRDPKMATYTMHGCRRAYASACARVLRNPFLVKALLAHAISGVTEMYVIVEFEQKAEAAALVAEWLMARLVDAPVPQLTYQAAE